MNVNATHPTAETQPYAALNRAVGLPASPGVGVDEALSDDRSVFAGMMARLLAEDPATDTTPDLSAADAAEKREQELRGAAEQLVATTFIMPLFNQLRNDPMASERFHGGRGEKVFQQQLDQVLSDRISTGAGFDLVDTVADYFAGRRGGVAQARSAAQREPDPVLGLRQGVDLHG